MTIDCNFQYFVEIYTELPCLFFVLFVTNTHNMQARTCLVKHMYWLGYFIQLVVQYVIYHAATATIRDAILTCA